MKKDLYKETLDGEFCPNTENNNQDEVLDSDSVNNENDTIPTEKTQVFEVEKQRSAEFPQVQKKHLTQTKLH